MTVLLATFNGERFLEDQLESIARQSHRHWSLLVSDDGSTDRTVEIVNRFSAANPGRVHMLPRQQAGSASGNFIRLLRAAPPSPLYALADQDDVWHEDKLSTLVARSVETNASAAVPQLVYSDMAVVSEDLVPISPSFTADLRVDPHRLTFGSLLVENSIAGCSALFNSALMKVFRQFEGPLDDARMHDWWLALIAKALGRIDYVPTPLVMYRQHTSNAAGSVDRRGLKFALQKLRSGRAAEIKSCARQARLFATAYGRALPEARRRQVQALSRFDHSGRTSRLSLTVRYGLWKQTWTRRIFQIMFI